MDAQLRNMAFAFRPAAESAANILIEDLTLPQGQLSVITGPSGSGKSTLLYLLCGLLQPQHGTIEWAGTDLAAMSEGARDKWRRQHAGIVFQNFHLFPEMTPKQNVTISAYFSGWSAEPLKARAEDLLARFGVDDEMRATASYSRGEQQRIALARALLHKPEILFADEPTASLDRRNGEAIANLLSRFAHEDGRTVVAVSHDPALIRLADHIVRLDHGRLVKLQGSVAA